MGMCDPPLSLSSQASSMERSESGEGMASGAKRAVWIARKWERRVEISEGVRPAWVRRSKPWGRGVVVVLFGLLWLGG